VDRLGERGRARPPRPALVSLGRLDADDRHTEREPDRQEPDPDRLGSRGARADPRRRDRRRQVEAIPIGVDPGLEDAHARSTGFDPRTLADEYVYLRIAPQEIQAWRESNELEGRVLMRDGAWLE
jgi:hypothetical protein